VGSADNARKALQAVVLKGLRQEELVEKTSFEVDAV
jgi:hypothetical protein